MVSTPDLVRIHYRRPPDREDIFVQRLIAREDGCVVTLMQNTRLDGPVTVEGTDILQNGSPVVWFTFDGAWHDIGLFHTADGHFTGTYANILTPVRFLDSLTWETTDLFLDVWLEPNHRARILDLDELIAARAEGTIDGALAERAQAEARSLVERAAAGTWPPPVVQRWPLQRAIEQIASD